MPARRVALSDERSRPEGRCRTSLGGGNRGEGHHGCSRSVRPAPGGRCSSLRGGVIAAGGYLPPPRGTDSGPGKVEVASRSRPWSRGLSVGQFVGQIRGTQGNVRTKNPIKSTTCVPPQTPAAPYRMGSSPISHPLFSFYINSLERSDHFRGPILKPEGMRDGAMRVCFRP